MAFKNYRLWKYPIRAVPTTGNVDGRYCEPIPEPTRITFKARTEAEAMRKADAFWQRGKFGMGRIFVKEESVKFHEGNVKNEDPPAPQ